MKRALPVLAALLIASVTCDAGLSPRELSQALLSPAPGAQLPLDTEFVTSDGGPAVTLGQAIGDKPTVLILADYTCRFICGTTLAIAASGLSQTGLNAGTDFSFAVIGINPKDGRADAEAMKAAQLAPYPSLQSSASFLSGNAEAIARVMGALNYRPVYDAERGEYAHPVGVIILTLSGRVSRFIGGLNLQGENLRTALLNARESQLSTLAEGIRLLCYGHDPLHGAASSAVQAALTAFGLMTLSAMGAMLAYLVRRKGQRP